MDSNVTTLTSSISYQSGSVSPTSAQSGSRVDNPAQNLQRNEQLNPQAEGAAQAKIEEQLKETQQLREQQRDSLAEQREQLKSVVDSLNQIPDVQKRDVKFVVDDRNGELFTSVFNKSTDELIREIPTEEFRELQQRLANFQDAISETTGLFVDQMV
ncbi:flagellar protein FlaG [Aliagarivorans taiwanensis]|uniref:flagellar protein FlaG n=1 Tax=Aliagarivorans taiwanensis TaxID=561966 RepID=UPI0009FFDD19|nr:flagellar protein FlaG [Aliagarivorans taiwanensis]